MKQEEELLQMQRVHAAKLAQMKMEVDEEEKRGLRRLSACVLIRLTDVLHQQEHHHEHGCPHLEQKSVLSGGTPRGCAARGT